MIISAPPNNPAWYLYSEVIWLATSALSSTLISLCYVTSCISRFQGLGCGAFIEGAIFRLAQYYRSLWLLSLLLLSSGHQHCYCVSLWVFLHPLTSKTTIVLPERHFWNRSFSCVHYPPVVSIMYTAKSKLLILLWFSSAPFLSL